MKLWQKGKAAHHKVDQFTVGSDREYDLLLAAYDCEASSAHAQMLAKIEILTQEEADLLTLALNQLKEKAQNGSFTIEDEFEDMHSKIEQVLTEQLGDLGKKNTHCSFPKRSSFGRHALVHKRRIVSNQKNGISTL
jgi:argininosuccinate lyase